MSQSASTQRAFVGGVSVPRFVYGTAWKEDRTEGLVGLALEAGFLGIDTANQRKHYHEAGVGAALARALAEGVIERDALFLQTKFTHLAGQDHRLPYDPEAPVATQVEQSFASSLEHLGVDRIDSYVLHGPSVRHGLASEDLEAWRAMEAVHGRGRVGILGVSNVGIDQLELLWEQAEVRPSVVQNRCYARLGWDRQVRSFCKEQGILYQGFSLLTANRAELQLPAFRELVERLGWTPSQVVFTFALQVGMICLTGTRDPGHMAEDLQALDLALTDEDLALMEAIGE